MKVAVGGKGGAGKTTPRDEDSVREYAARHSLPLTTLVPYDDAVVAADERGMALIEHGPASPSVAAIRSLADDLLRSGAARAGQAAR